MVLAWSKLQGCRNDWLSFIHIVKYFTFLLSCIPHQTGTLFIAGDVYELLPASFDQLHLFKDDLNINNTNAAPHIIILQSTKVPSEDIVEETADGTINAESVLLNSNIPMLHTHITCLLV